MEQPTDQPAEAKEQFEEALTKRTEAPDFKWRTNFINLVVISGIVVGTPAVLTGLTGISPTFGDMFGSIVLGIALFVYTSINPTSPEVANREMQLPNPIIVGTPATVPGLTPGRVTNGTLRIIIWLLFLGNISLVFLHTDNRATCLRNGTESVGVIKC